MKAEEYLKERGIPNEVITIQRDGWIEGHTLSVLLKEYAATKQDGRETKAVQKQSDDPYHLACQNCGTTSKPLQMVPFRNNDNVVGLLTACDGCKGLLYGQRFDREEKFTPQQPSEEVDDTMLGLDGEETWLP